MALEQHDTAPAQDENTAALAVGGLRSKKRTKTAYARVDEEGGGEEGAASAAAEKEAASEEAPSASATRSRIEAPRRRGAGAEGRAVPEEWDGFGAEGDVEDEGEYDGDEEDDGYGGGPRRGSSVAVVLLVLFVVLGVAGFFAKQTYSGGEPDGAPPSGAAAPEATPGGPENGEGEQDPGYSRGSESERAGVEETGLVVSQEDDGAEGLYVRIGDETWRGEIAPGEGADGEVLALDGPTAANVKMGFRTRDPEALVDNGSFGVYAPGGGLVYATVQRTRAFGAEEAETRGTYTVIGISGEYYSGTYADSSPESGGRSAGDRVVRTYTVEEGLPQEEGPSAPEGGADGRKTETFRVAYELESVEGEGGRPIVPQLLGWHAPDGKKLEEIVESPK